MELKEAFMRTLRFGLVGFISFWAVTLGLIALADSAIIRVKTNGNDANSGASWVLAKKTVQGAINAGNAGDEIWVASGTYQENIQNKIVNIGGTDTAIDMALYGGFAGTETNRNERNWLTNIAILDGNNSGNVITITGGAGPETRVDGFYILNGSSGISSSNSGPTITNNVIGRNSNSGIYLANYKFDTLSGPFYFPIVTLNTILSNTSSYGAGIHIFGARGLRFRSLLGPSNHAQHDCLEHRRHNRRRNRLLRAFFSLHRQQHHFCKFLRRQRFYRRRGRNLFHSPG